MPGNPHPAVAPFEAHDDEDLIAMERLHYRLIVADATEVRNTDLSGQVAGLFIRSTGNNYALDTTSTDADDGFDVIIDAAGNHFVRIAASAAEAKVEKTITAAGDVVIEDDEVADVIAINKTVPEATNVFLPDAALRSKSIQIVDKAGVALTFPITIRPKAASGQTVMTGSQFVLDGNGMALELLPWNDGSGWH